VPQYRLRAAEADRPGGRTPVIQGELPRIVIDEAARRPH